MVKKLDDESKFLENLNLFRNKIKSKDIDNINNWDEYKKKDKFSIISKNFKNKKILKNNINYNYKNKVISFILENCISLEKLNNIKIWNSRIDILKNVNLFYNDVYKKYLNINFKKINLYKNKLNYSIDKHLLIIIDIRSMKSKIIASDTGNCLASVTNGMMFKRLQLRNKKYKKSEKLTYLSMKALLIKLSFLKGYKNIFINLKGVKSNIINIIKYISTKVYLKNKKFIYIHNNSFSKNPYFKFKKIKAIKKKLKKKIIKYK